jgi:hypothetical protein
MTSELIELDTAGKNTSLGCQCLCPVAVEGHIEIRIPAEIVVPHDSGINVEFMTPELEFSDIGLNVGEA